MNSILALLPGKSAGLWIGWNSDLTIDWALFKKMQLCGHHFVPFLSYLTPAPITWGRTCPYSWRGAVGRV